MAKNRNERQEAIRDIIRTQSVRTQFALVDALKERGFTCTQATVSRDITEMGLCKQAEGAYILKEDLHLQRMVGTLVVEATHANNLALVKATSGSASAVAVALDAAELSGVVGTVAGDDTILVVCEDEARALEVVATVEKLQGKA